MAAAGDEPGTKRAHTARQRWSATFPDDLLAVVYHMIASQLGRVRFAAVCRSWRAAARCAQPVPALPLLLLSPRDCSGTKALLHCPEDGAIVPLRYPSKAVVKCIVGCHDEGWVASSLPDPFRIVNLFSGAEVPLNKKQAIISCTSRYHGSGQVQILKVVFSGPPKSGECILAALTYNCGIALCRVGCPNTGWSVEGCPNKPIVDILFWNGELYSLLYDGHLIKFEIGMNEDGAPVITATHWLVIQRIGHAISEGYYRDYVSYIFDLEGKFAMALRRQWLPNLDPFFKVFTLVPICEPNACYKQKWLEVTSLGDHALFLGETFSKAVHVTGNMPGGVKRNHIYYSHNCWLDQNIVVSSDKVFFTISNDNVDHTYYKIDDTNNEVTGDGDYVKGIRSVGYFKKGCLDGGMWIIPPNL